MKSFSWTIAVLVSAAVCAGGEQGPLVESGEFRRIYDPSVGESARWYINDHTFIRDAGGTWHLIGITHQEPANPLDEKHLAHAVSGSLTGSGWKKLPFALDFDAASGETLLWAPYVFQHAGTYYMFYCAGGPEHVYSIRLATSKDLKTWTRSKANPLFTDGYDARDPFVMRVGDTWVLYYTATTGLEGGNHIVAYRTSKDLEHWSERKIAYTDPEKGTYGGPTESPFVVHRGEYYYLFIGPRGSYDNTEVLRSRSPFEWKLSDKVGRIPAHAAEVIQDADGKWYVSRCGWDRNGVYLAPLIWHDGVTK